MTKPAKTHTGTGINQTTRLHTPQTLRASLAMGAVGAVVGGTAAAARNISRVNKSEITRSEAVTDSIKEAGTTGAATAVAGAVVSSVGLTGTLSLVGLVAVAIGAKYAADKVLSSASATCAKALTPAESTTEEKSAGTKKTADAKK